MSRREIERITRVWQRRLGLGDWDIKVRWGLPTAAGTDAQIKIHDYHEQASFRIGRNYRTWDERLANHVVVHELLHIYEHETRKAARGASEQFKAEGTGNVFWAWYLAGSERWVDKLAVAIIEMGGNA